MLYQSRSQNHILHIHTVHTNYDKAALTSVNSGAIQSTIHSTKPFY
ncbi:MAG: hypothetical protein ACI9Q9_001127 [Flavobacterium sp.]|jgi:hypothetical protein